MVLASDPNGPKRTGIVEQTELVGDSIERFIRAARARIIRELFLGFLLRQHDLNDAIASLTRVKRQGPIRHPHYLAGLEAEAASMTPSSS